MMSLYYKSAVELAQDIRSKEVSCRELLECFLDRVAEFNPILNAIAVCDAESARERAIEADEALAKGNVWGPLHGIPMTVKESFDVQGLPTTWGVPAFRDYRPLKTASAVRRLTDSGAIVFGKTNVPTMLGDWQSDNPIYGRTNNPWNLSLTPGGSSGGSAAALAAGLTGLELGSDMASSIRNPAHYCGVYGHKSTRGAISSQGQRPPGRVAQPDIAVVGPMARSAKDLQAVLPLLGGPDDFEAAAWSFNFPAPRCSKASELRVAVMLSTPHANVELVIQDGIQRLADHLARAGARVDDEARPALDTVAVDRLFRSLMAAASSGGQTKEEYHNNRLSAEQLKDDDFSQHAQEMRAYTLSHREWLQQDEARQKMRFAWAEFFENFDVLICPSVAGLAFPHNQAGRATSRSIEINGKEIPIADQLFWAGYSGAFYLPATVAPIGISRSGLPFGVQIIGGHYQDLTCVRVAELIERDFFAFMPPPGYEHVCRGERS